MITFQNLGFMISVMISGALADSPEKPRILLIGSLILSAAFLSFYLIQIFSVNLFIMFIIGVGIGTYEGVTDAILITVYLIFLQMDWRNAVTQSRILVLILVLIFGQIKLASKKKPAEPYLERMRVLTHVKFVLIYLTSYSESKLQGSTAVD